MRRNFMENPKFWILAFSIVYVIGFLIAYIVTENYEFIGYIVVMVILILLVYQLNKNYNFPSWILAGLSLWGIIHMAGGIIPVKGDVLYKLILIPIYQSPEIAEFVLLKYDQFAHFYFYLFATLFVYYLLKPYLNKVHNWKIVAILLVFTGMGIGALNEIIEFIMVLTLVSTGVGGYYNTLLDIVFNTLGAIVAVLILSFKKLEKIK